MPQCGADDSCKEGDGGGRDEDRQGHMVEDEMKAPDITSNCEPEPVGCGRSLIYPLHQREAQEAQGSAAHNSGVSPLHSSDIQVDIRLQGRGDTFLHET